MKSSDPAFPVKPEYNDSGEPQIYTGLNKREWLASMAMQAIVSNVDYDTGPGEYYVAVARESCRLADALLAKLGEAS